MKIVGCDFHPSFQQVAILDVSTGEVEELKLLHASGEAERFYRDLEVPALIGMEAMGNTLWFERLVEELGHQLWIGDAAQIRASYVRRQKTDRRDAGHILQLLIEKRFPRIWVPSRLERDQRQLLLHRHRLVSMRTGVKTELQHLALNQGLQKKRSLWGVRGRAELEKLPLECPGLVIRSIRGVNSSAQRDWEWRGRACDARTLLTSGMDLAFRVVQRYFGREIAAQTATLLEYQGQGWLNANSNSEFAGPIHQTADHPVCAVCGMEIDRSLLSTYKGKTYYFCVQEHKRIFDASPEKFAAE